MGNKSSIIAALLASVSLTMCASVDGAGEAPKRAASDADPKPSGAVIEELAELGIDVEAPASKEDWSAVLGVEQVTTADEDRNYAFADVEGVHPCQREEILTDDCREISARLAEELDRASGDPNRGSALSEIQALTPDVVDPQSFDPVVTAGELGRQPIPQSQAAQALGFQLLQPPVPPPAEPEPEEPGVDDFGTLPDIPLDIIVNQTPGGGS
ncbi:MAG: hypothetical protein AAFY34_01755 [Pseudomonadota bacterium]